MTATSQRDIGLVEWCGLSTKRTRDRDLVSIEMAEVTNLLRDVNEWSSWFGNTSSLWSHVGTRDRARADASGHVRLSGTRVKKSEQFGIPLASVQTSATCILDVRSQAKISCKTYVTVNKR